MKGVSAFLAGIVCLTGALSFVGCNAAEYYEITLENETAVVQKQARAGETVILEATEGYEICSIIVNGVELDRDSFVMPASDVTLRVILASTDEDAHRVIVSELQDGKTVPDHEKANAGDTVTLETYVTYGNEVECYYVNGERIDGNTFVMPDEDVTVTTLYKSLLRPTDVTLSVTQSYQTATSHWYAAYSESGVTVEAAVEDNIVYTHGYLSDDVFYGDNIEFVIGKRTDRNGLDANSYRVVVNADGAYRFMRRSGGNWIDRNKSDITVTAKRCTVFEQGFCGYLVNVFLPYSSLGTTYADGYGQISMNVSMRNTVNSLKSNWKAFSGLNSSWEDRKTHMLIGTDGTFAANNFNIENLFAGDGLFSFSNWSSFYDHLSEMDDVYSVAAENRDVVYWTENLRELSSREPQNVYFSANALTGSVLSEFDQMRTFLTAFSETLPHTKLHLISALPGLSEDVSAEKVNAYNAMVKEYVAETGCAEYIDLNALFCRDGKINMLMYATGEALSEEGYLTLSKILLGREDSGVVWGDMGVYTQTSGWTEQDGRLLLEGGGTQKTYWKQEPGNEFRFTVEISAVSVLNSDAYPKFGLTLQDGTKSMSFYIDGSNNLSTAEAGVVEQIGGIYDWNGSFTVSVPGLVYTNGNYATLELVQTENDLQFYVNSTLVYRSSHTFGEHCVPGLFAFNTRLSVRNWSLAAEVEA